MHSDVDGARVAPWLRVPLIRRLVFRYGWRAYALPFLAILSVVALLRPSGSSQAEASPSHRVAASRVNAAPATTTPSTATSTAKSTAMSTATSTVAPSTTPVRTTPTPTAAVPPSAAASTVCATNRAAQLVLVSLSQQHAWMCSGRTLLQQSAVTTGETDNGDQTPTGTWQVYSRETNRNLVGPGYVDYVQFWVPFNGDFGFHDASWQTMPFGSPDYTTQGSHGCVHLPTPMMSWLYQWVKVGASVTVAA